MMTSTSSRFGGSIFIFCLLFITSFWNEIAAAPHSPAGTAIKANAVILAAAEKPKTAAIPRGKSGKTGIMSLPGSDMFLKLYREAKIGFCSELEALTLQLTRPNTVEISMAAVGEVINFVNLEYDNPQLIISLLVKFSRKLAEHNVYTKLKSLLVLHKVMENVQDKARAGLYQAITSLRAETDEKVSAPFFSTIEDAAAMAANVAEIEAVELARVYYEYVFEFIQTRGSIALLVKEGGSKATISQKKADIAESLLNLVDLSLEAETCCKRASTPLNKQCMESLKVDRKWLLVEMNKLYKTETDEELRDEMEEVLQKYDPNFKPIPKYVPPPPPNAENPTSFPQSSSAAAKPGSSMASGPGSAPLKKAPTFKPAPKMDDDSDDDEVAKKKKILKKKMKPSKPPRDD